MVVGPCNNKKQSRQFTRIENVEGVYRKHGSCENSVNHKSVIERKLELSRVMECESAKITDVKKLLSHFN